MYEDELTTSTTVPGLGCRPLQHPLRPTMGCLSAKVAPNLYPPDLLLNEPYEDEPTGGIGALCSDPYSSRRPMQYSRQKVLGPAPLHRHRPGLG